MDTRLGSRDPTSATTPDPVNRGLDTDSSPDVVVIGGGPAGAAAARLLALRGHSVWVLTRRGTSSRDLAESLPPSCGRLFDALGATEVVATAGFLPAGGNMVVWGGHEPSSVPFPDGPGWQVRRGVLAKVLLNLAREAGAFIQDDATVVEVAVPSLDAPPGERRSGVDVRYHRSGDPLGSSGGCRSVRARFILDCSGRAGVLASRFRGGEDRPATRALVGVWQGTRRSGVEDRGYTLVESYRDGWVWSIPVDHEHRYFTAMVDPELTPLDDASGLEGAYIRELRKAKFTAELLQGGELVGRVSAWGATPYQTTRFCGPGFLLVGDAAAFIDPLSSYGVKRALASGWLASVVAHTAITDFGREAIALRFFEDREREVVKSFHDQATKFYRTGAETYGHEFWHRRSGGIPSASTGQSSAGEEPRPFDDRPLPHEFLSGSGVPDIAQIRSDPRVLAAFQRLRAAEHVDLRPASGLDWTEGPAIQGDEVILESRLVTPSFPGGLRFLREVDVVRLVQLLDGLRALDSGSTWGVPQLHEKYERMERSIPLPDFIGALSVLLAEGAVVNGAYADRPEARLTEGSS